MVVMYVLMGVALFLVLFLFFCVVGLVSDVNGLVKQMDRLGSTKSPYPPIEFYSELEKINMSVSDQALRIESIEEKNDLLFKAFDSVVQDIQ